MRPGTKKDESQEREQRLARVITRYLDNLGVGEKPDRRELVRRHPDLAPELERYFADEDHFHQLERTVGLIPTGELSVSPDPAVGGDTFGPYELVEEIARGGMGIVFKARHRSLHRTVALKMVLRGNLARESELQRFRIEAEAAARLEHPNIVPIYDLGEQNGLPFFTMKFIEGDSLEKQLDRFSTSPAAAVHLVEKVSRAVQYAHERGVLHRDIKPGNILVDSSDEPYLTDFGLAKNLESEDGNLTGSNAVVGTLNYMAPEQAESSRKEITTAADTYSLGAILYELLTRRPPFRGKTSAEILTRVLHEDPVTPFELGCQISRDLQTICMKCLEKDPRRRYSSAGALADDLRRFLNGEPILAWPRTPMERTISWIRRRPVVALLLAVSVAALVSLFVLSLRYNQSLRQRAEANAELAKLARRVVYANRIRQAFEDCYQGGWTQAASVLDEYDAPRPAGTPGFEWYHLFRLLHRESAVLPVDRGAIETVAFSPTGTTLAAGTRAGLVVLWDVATGEETSALRAHTAAVHCLAFSSDGARLVSGSGDGNVILWNVRDGTPRQLRNCRQGAVRSIFISADDKKLLTANLAGSVKQWNLPGLRKSSTFSVTEEPLTSIAFSDRGPFQLAAATARGTVQLWRRGRKKRSSLEVGDGAIHSLAFTPDGKTLATGSTAGEIHLWNTTSRVKMASLPGHRGPVVCLSFSPGADVLASGGQDGTLRFWDLSLSRIVRTITAHSTSLRSIFWDRDAGRLATIASDGSVKLWQARDLDEPRDLENHADIVSGIGFTPDGKSLVTASAGSIFRLWELAPRASGGPAIVARATLEAPGREEYVRAALSPDGTRAAGLRADFRVEVLKLGWDGDESTIETEAVLPGHEASITGHSFSSDSALLVTAAGAEVKTWERMAEDGDGWSERNRFVVSTEPVEIVVFSPDASLLGLASRSQPALELRDPRTGKRLNSLSQIAAVRSLAFTRDGRRLAVGCADRSFTVWQLDPVTYEASALTTLRGHLRAVTAVAFTPDSLELATGGVDGTVKFWDLITTPTTAMAAELATLKGHRSRIHVLSFSPDGKILVTGGGRENSLGEVKVWRAATDEEVRRWSSRGTRAAD